MLLLTSVVMATSKLIFVYASRVAFINKTKISVLQPLTDSWAEQVHK